MPALDRDAGRFKGPDGVVVLDGERPWRGAHARPRVFEAFSRQLGSALGTQNGKLRFGPC